MYITKKLTMTRICVIGAGIVGLSTARILLETIPRIQLTVIGETFTPDTTSNVAAGIYKPEASFHGPTTDITEKWLHDSLSYIKDMVHNNSEEAQKAGIVPRSGYLVSTDMPELVQSNFLSRVLDEHRPCTVEERLLYPSGNYKHGTFMSTYLIDNAYYLPYLTQKIEDLGGKFVQKFVKSFDELSCDFDIICNCSGLGSRRLCNDLTVSPIRGQLLKVKAPWIKKFVYLDYDTYIIPGVDYVTLGGTRQFDWWNKKVDKYDTQSIWEKCVKAIPSLKDAQISKICVGWRPYRPVVRVEKENVISSNGKVLKIVHNYGHGGYGVMSAVGTSMHAASLVREYINSTSKL